MNRQHITALILSLTNLAAIGAEGTQSSVDLGESVIVASGREQTLMETPHTVYQIDEDEARLRLQAPTMTDALSTVPGVMLQKTGHGMTSPFLRGFTSQRVVLVSDGVRLNNSFLREGPNQYWNQVDPYFFKDLEVMMGPNSVLYGSEAVGGVVYARSAALTRGAADDGFQWQGGEVLARYASAENSFSEHVEGAFSIDDKWSMRLGLTRQDFGQLESGDGDNPHTNYEQWGLNLRLQYWINDSNSLIFGYDHFDQDNVDRVHRTIYHQDFKGTLSKGKATDLARIYDHDRRNVFARYEMRDGGLIEELDLQLSYTDFSEYYVRHKSATDVRYRPTDIDTLGVTLQMRNTSNLGIWSYGVDFYHDWVDSTGWNIKNGTRTDNIQGLVADDSTYSLAGIYLQNEAALTDVLTMTTGVRYSYADLDAGKVNFPGTGQGSLDGDWDALTGSIRFLLQATDTVNIFTGVSQGFRAPNLSDATREDDFGGGQEAPTADLDAEHFTTLELGARRVTDRSQLNAILYHTIMKDRVGRVRDSGSATKRNLDDGYVQGVELSGSAELTDRLSVFGYVAWQEGREDHYIGREITAGAADRPVSRMHPLSGEFGFRWTAEANRWWSEISVEAAQHQEHLTDAEISDNRFVPGDTPGYAVYHLRGGYKINDQTDISLALENISDVDYRIHGSGVNEPGRNFVATLRYKF